MTEILQGVLSSPTTVGGTTTVNLPVGFDLKALVVFATDATGEALTDGHAILSMGWATKRGGSVQQMCNATIDRDVVGNQTPSQHPATDAVVRILDSAGPTLVCTVDFTTSEQFVLTATTAPAVARRLHWIAFGGLADAQAHAFSVAFATTQDVALGAGFGQPDLVFFMPTGWSSDGLKNLTLTTEWAGMGLGVAKSSKERRAMCWSNKAASIMESTHVHANRAFIDPTDPLNMAVYADLSDRAAWPTDGYELSYFNATTGSTTASTSSAHRVFALALKFADGEDAAAIASMQASAAAAAPATRRYSMARVLAPGEASTGAGSTHVATLPNGREPDDLLMAVISSSNPVSTAPRWTVDDPAVWEERMDEPGASSGMSIFTAKSSDVTVAPTFTSTDGTTARIAIYPIRGVNPDNIIDFAFSDSGGTDTVNAPSLTATADGQFLVCAVAGDGVTGTSDVVTPEQMDRRLRSISGSPFSLAVVASETVMTGATGTRTFVHNEGDDLQAFSMLLQPRTAEIKFALLFGGGQAQNTNLVTSGTSNSGFFVGATDGVVEGSVGACQDDGNANSFTGRFHSESKVYETIRTDGGAPTLLQAADAALADGNSRLDLTYSSVDSTRREISYLFIGTVVGETYVNATAIASSEAVGSPTIIYDQYISPSGIGSSEDFGAVNAYRSEPEPDLPEFRPSGYEKYSGVEINQNPEPTHALTPGTWTPTTFSLPGTFKRGNYIPEITGLQLCMDVSDADALVVNVKLEANVLGAWETFAAGSVRKAHAEGTHVWIDIYFDNPIPVEEALLNRDWRFQVYSRAQLRGTEIEGEFVPNYRLLAMTADTGEDFLGNKYRAVVTRNAVDRFNTQATDQVNAYWLSKPNPSKYAVECLYFDVRDGDNPTVVDRVLLDPITPGMWFHVYYTNEGEPGTTNEEWEEKLWTPVAKSFQADRREEHALPEPIAAKYICVEFSHLQAQYYSAGTFQQPIRYRKHPKWVLDYFLARLSASDVTDDPFVARRVKVVYDAFELAYDYYVDDLVDGPTHPEVLLPAESRNVAPFLAERGDVSDQVEASTLERIKLSLRPYQEHPGRLAKGLDYLLGLYAEGSATNNYPIERVTPARADTSQVSTLDRGNLIVEQNHPVMFFYLTSRHKYRVVEASFREDRAYFAGVRELAFTREHYATASDTQLYVETLTDFANVARNDFIEDEYPPYPLGGGA